MASAKQSLRVQLMQQRYSLSDPGMEKALIEVPTMRLWGQDHRYRAAAFKPETRPGDCLDSQSKRDYRAIRLDSSRGCCNDPTRNQLA